MGLEPMMMSAWKADAVATEPHPQILTALYLSIGADGGARTRDIMLGKHTFYH